MTLDKQMAGRCVNTPGPATKPGVDGLDVPTLTRAVKSEAQRVRERGVPAPLPRSLYAGEGEGEGEDPTIRSAA